ncbi:hypothetical protein [Streptomyces sp. NPDC002588]|uniref:hypothetical protein n=1 Tax=Streptomyces sp. NPDC002588 TaxID=3154419 RepID=UPI003323A5EE
MIAAVVPEITEIRVLRFISPVPLQLKRKARGEASVQKGMFPHIPLPPLTKIHWSFMESIWLVDETSSFGMCGCDRMPAGKYVGMLRRGVMAGGLS